MKRIKHNLLCFTPFIMPVIITRQWRVAIPPVNLFFPHPASFKTVIAMRQINIAVIHRLHQRINNIIINIICQIARRYWPRKTAPAIFNLFVFGDGIHHQRQQSLMIFQSCRQGLACLFAFGRIVAG